MDATIIKKYFEINYIINNANTSVTKSSTSSSSSSLQNNTTNTTTGTSTVTDNKSNSIILQIPEKTIYPVEIFYLNEPCRNYLETCVDTILNIHSTDQEGCMVGQCDILVFLPGSEEIDFVTRMMNERIAQSSDLYYQQQEQQTSYDYYNNKRSKTNTNSSNNIYENLYILPLYANLSTQTQLQVFRQTPKNTRKIILATNIAETSITIEGVKYVIDCCFVKLNYYDFLNNIDMLITVPVSVASANQRAGRCGKLYSYLHI